jgi:transcriptional regulator with XRE-family HTH domain
MRVNTSEKKKIASESSIDRSYLLSDALFMADSDVHFGEWLRQKVLETGLPGAEFAEKAKVSESSLYRWYRQRAPSVFGHKVTRLAAALGIPREEVQSILLSAMQRDPQTIAKWKEQARRMKMAGPQINEQIAEWESMKREGLVPSDDDQIDQNIEPYSERPVPEIPTFDLEIAAGPWSEVTQAAELHSPQKIDDGRFRIYVRGDSMQPDWPDGGLVEFRCLRPAGLVTDGDTLKIGEDYYVQVGDEATFKRLTAFDDDQLVLRAINYRKYPKPLIAVRNDIVRMAIAEWKLERPQKTKIKETSVKEKKRA